VSGLLGVGSAELGVRVDRGADGGEVGGLVAGRPEQEQRHRAVAVVLFDAGRRRARQIGGDLAVDGAG